VIQKISPKQLKERIDTKSDLVLLDCREADEFAYTHIKESINIPISEFEKRVEKEIKKDKPIIIISHLEERALRACEYLEEKGFENITYLEGGLEAWSLEIDSKVKRY